MPNVLITSKGAKIPIANPTSALKKIKKGDVLGMAQKLNEFFNKVANPEIIKNESSEVSSEGEEYRLKTTAMPDSETYNSEDLWSLLDIGDLQLELAQEAWDMLESHKQAFRFDGDGP
ncbi:hypothetical protein ARMGADRAFT_1086850 [Armillaria gallica]|uniref:Uncharacterized protein n=1 Tax=Armillaria gallica TaxID=47427 RepID=A0A2H3CX96_ARMGA|nr:hypothetical protein ARMGADRAFT_1086850 [Armillaria gallica]